MKELKITFFDTETGGLPLKHKGCGIRAPYNWPALLSVAWLTRKLRYYVPEKLEDVSTIETPDTYYFRTLMGDRIEPEALAINGLDPSTHTRLPADILQVLRAFNNSDIIIAHNAAFDFNMIAAAVRKYGIPESQAREHLKAIEKKIVCSAELTRYVLKILKPEGYDNNARNDKASEPYKRPSLAELYAYSTGISRDTAHDAMSDTEDLTLSILTLLRQDILTIKDLQNFKFKNTYEA